MSCINKSLPEYKKLAKSYGDTTAEAIVRKMTLIRGGDFFIPSPRQASRFLNKTNQIKFEIATTILKNNPYLSEGEIVKVLKGTITPHKKSYFVVKGWDTGMLTSTINEVEIFEPNLKIVRELEKLYPDIFKVKPIENKHNVVTVTITPRIKKSLGNLDQLSIDFNGDVQYNRDNKKEYPTYKDLLTEGERKLKGGIGKEEIIEEEERLLASNAITTLLSKMSDNLGVETVIITEGEAIKLTEKTEDPYNGESGFFFKGKVYLVEDKWNIDTKLHELIHPFVRAVAKDNPELFRNLYKSALENEQLLEEIKLHYPRLAKLADMGEIVPLMEEFLVHVIQKIATNRINATSQTISWIQRLWNAIKYLLRKLYNPSVDLSSLNANMTLEEVTDILVNSNSLIKVKDSELSYIPPAYNRTFVPEMKKIQEKDGIDEKIKLFYNLIRSQANTILSNKNLREQFESIIGKEETADNSPFFTATRQLKTAKDIMEIINKEEDKLLSFAEAITSLSVFLENTLKHIETLMNDKNLPPEYAIKALRNASFIISDWKGVLIPFSKNTPLFTEGPLKSKLNKILSDISEVENHTNEWLTHTGLPDILVKDFESNIYLVESINKLKSEIAEQKEKFNKGDKSIERKLKENEALLEKINPTKENITNWLSGQMGDANPYSHFWESATSNPNLIVGGFANFYSKQRLKVESKMNGRVTNFFNKLTNLYGKITAFTQNSIDEIFEKITDKETRGYIDQEGNLQKEEVHVLANQYSGAYHYILTEHDYNISKEFDENGKSEKYFSLRKAKQTFEQKYMFTRESGARSEATAFWKTSPLHEEISEERRKLYTLINSKKDQLNKAISREDYEQLKTDIKFLERELKNMSSTIDINNNPKDEIGVAKANIIKEYNDKFGGMYEQREITDAFSTALTLAKGHLLQSGMEEGYEEYNRALNSWIKDNISVKLSDTFYEERKVVLDKIDKILSKLSSNERKKLDIGNKWKEMFNVVAGFRDQNGQLIGTDMTLSHQATVKGIEEEMDNIKRRLKQESNLTEDEQIELTNLLNRIDRDIELTQEEVSRYEYLHTKTNSANLSKQDMLNLNQAFQELADIQVKIPTEYYKEIMNDWLNGTGIELSDEIDPNIIEKAFNNKDFKKWFLANHRLKQKYIKHEGVPGEYIDYYERTYIWNVILPNDSQVIELIENNDYSTLMSSNHKHISITPNSFYHYFKLKREFITPKIVGVTIDNRGMWLPRPTQRSATPEQVTIMNEYKIPFAEDGEYESKKYVELITNPGLKDYKILLDAYKEFHLETQVNKPSHTKLWMDVPRMRKTSIERFNIENAKGKWGEFKNWLERVNPFVTRETEDAYSRGVGNFNVESAVNYFVTTDLHGEKITRIPVKYTQRTPLEEVSHDLGMSLVKYGVSAEMSEMLHEMNPIAEAFMDTLSNNRIQEVKLDKFGKVIKATSKNIRQLADALNIKVLSDKKESNMYKGIRALYERDFLGEEKKLELGVGVDRVAQHLMKFGAIGSLAFSPVAGIRNNISGNIQLTLEAVTGKIFNYRDILEGKSFFFTKVVPDLIRDYHKVGERGLYSQLYDLLDPIMGYSDSVGGRANISTKRDLADGKIIWSWQKLGEIDVHGTTAMVMLNNQKVDYVKDGETTRIKLRDAWEIKDNLITLKEGVDKGWDKNGDKFLQFKLRLQKVNERLQGAYAKENASEAQRYTSGSLVHFMRKYFRPMFLNRFAKKRVSIAEGDVKEGYFRTLIQEGVPLLNPKNWEDIRDRYHNLTPEEKGNILRALSEVGYSLFFMLLISLLGFDDDDDEKWEKLREAPWIQTYAIYQVMAIKSETETFIPFWGMGMDEWMRNIKTPTVAWNIVGKYRKLIGDLGNYLIGDEDAFYEKDYGLYEKGDIKFMADIYSLIGVRNWMLLDDPINGVKQYLMIQRRY